MPKHRRNPRAPWPLALAVVAAGAATLTGSAVVASPVTHRANSAPIQHEAATAVTLHLPPLELTSAVRLLPPLPRPTAPVVRSAPSVPAVQPAALPGGIAARAVAAALSLQGVPYVYGGTGRAGVDCSGLIVLAYRAAGVSLPRTAADQAAVGHSVSLSELRPGDILTYYRPVTHVVIYVGNGMIAEAAQPGTRVHVRPMYLQGFAVARRVTG